MKRALAFAAVVLAAASLSFGDIVRTTKSEITFKKFGTFTSEQTEKLSGDKKLSDMNSSFKGQGILGGLFKAFFPTGKTGELIDLGAKTITSIDHRRKEYTVTPIEKFVADRDAAMAQQKQQAAEEQPEAQAEAQESDIKIVRSEFKVEETGETKPINGFDCTKYLARWTIDWENVKTGDKGTDRLETALWTTPAENLSAAWAEESSFGAAYLKAMGIDATQLQSDVLGTQWISMFAGLDPAGGGSNMDPEAAGVAREMGKIKGYPIVTDGKYYPTPKVKAQEEARPAGGGGLIGGALGKLGGSLLKKKANPEADKAPAVAFYTEVKAIKIVPVDAAELQVPAGYKDKSK
jgi:hypothetical protein